MLRRARRAVDASESDSRADAGATPAPRPRRLGRGPALGVVLRLDRRAPARPAGCCGGPGSAATCVGCTPPQRRSAASRPAPRCSTCRAVAGWRCAGCGPARGSGTSPPTSPGPCSTAPWRRPRRRQVAAQVEPVLADVGALPFADAEFDLVVSFTGLHCFPDPHRAVREMGRVLQPGGVLTGSALLNDTGRALRAGPSDRPVRRPARPGRHQLPGRAVADRDRVRGHLDHGLGRHRVLPGVKGVSAA